jgi:hypothetical protein
MLSQIAGYLRAQELITKLRLFYGEYMSDVLVQVR